MADAPKKTKEERRAELARLLTSPGGEEKVLELLSAATGLPPGTMPGVVTLVFQTILDKEYPNG